MTANFLKIGFRQIRKDPFFSGLSLLGLSIGFTGLILLYAFITSENSFDKFQENYDRIYRVTTVLRQDGLENKFALTEGIFDRILVDEIPEVESSTAFWSVDKAVYDLISDKKTISVSGGLYADEDFLKVFGFRILSGSKEFNNINDIIISKKLALQLFNTEEAAGNIVEFKYQDKIDPFVVSAVVDDIPVNSSINFEFVVPGKTRGQYWTSQFESGYAMGTTVHLYFKTRAPYELTDLQSIIDRALEKQKQDPKNYLTPIQKLTDVHFNSDNLFEMSPGGNATYLKIFQVIMLGFLFISFVNLININGARFRRRLKEVGMRRVLGTNRIRLLISFVFETLLINFFCLSAGLLITVLTLNKIHIPYFVIDTRALASPGSLLTLGIVIFSLSVVGSIIPALRIVSVPISEAVKGKMGNQRKSVATLRASIVVIQIVATATMFGFALIIFRQLNYLNNKPLGYDKNAILCFQKPVSISTSQWREFKDQLKSQSIIESAGSSEMGFLGNRGLSPLQISPSLGFSFLGVWNRVDSGFLRTLNIKLLQQSPRLFNPPKETGIAVINEKAWKEMKTDSVVGSTFHCWKGDFEIVGVVNDFHFRPFNTRISPAVLLIDENSDGIFYARYRQGEHRAAVEAANKVWSQISDTNLDHYFLDDAFGKMLEREYQMSFIITLFAGVSIFISAIGLIGLIGQMTIELRKEIAIRKVFGLTVNQALALMGKQFLIFIGCGIVLGIPLVISLSNSWLENFEYKTELSAADFVLTFMVITVITMAVTMKQALSAARENPVKVIAE